MAVFDNCNGDSSVLEKHSAMHIVTTWVFAYLFGDSSDDEKKSRLVRLNCNNMTTGTITEVPLIKFCRII